MPYKKKLFWIVFLNVFLPLLIGLIIYLFYRPKLFPSISILGHKEALTNKSFLLKLLVNSGPDFCWSYSFASALFITNFIFFRNKLLLYITVIIIVWGEVIQIFLSRYFTFDWTDMVAAIMALALSWLILKNQFIWLRKRQDG